VNNLYILQGRTALLLLATVTGMVKNLQEYKDLSTRTDLRLT